jgi:hypothetical protein
MFHRYILEGQVVVCLRILEERGVFLVFLAVEWQHWSRVLLRVRVHLIMTF